MIASPPAQGRHRRAVVPVACLRMRAAPAAGAGPGLPVAGRPAVSAGCPAVRVPYYWPPAFWFDGEAELLRRGLAAAVGDSHGELERRFGVACGPARCCWAGSRAWRNDNIAGQRPVSPSRAMAGQSGDSLEAR